MHGGKISDSLFEQGLCLPSGAALGKEKNLGRVFACVLKQII